MNKLPIYVFVILLLCMNNMFAQEKSDFFLEGGKIYDIKGDGNTIWAASYGNGVFCYSKDDSTWTNYSSKNKSVDNDFFYCIEVSKNYVWAGTSGGLYTFDRRKRTWSKKRFPLGGEWGNWIRALCYDELTNTLWIGRFKYVTKLDVGKQIYTDIDRTIDGDQRTNNFCTIELDGDSAVWFGTENGIHKYNKSGDANNPASWEYLGNRFGGFNNEGEDVAISDILFESNYVWLATDEFITPEKPQFNTGGVYRYNRKNKWDKISKQNGLPTNGVYCLEKTGNYIWASVYAFDKKDKKEFGKGMVLLNRFTGKVIPVDLNQTSITTSTVYKLYFDGSDMWFGTNLGIFKLNISNPIGKWTAVKNAPPKVIKAKKTRKIKR